MIKSCGIVSGILFLIAAEIPVAMILQGDLSERPRVCKQKKNLQLKNDSLVIRVGIAPCNPSVLKYFNLVFLVSYIFV